MFEAILTFILLSWIFVELVKYWIRTKCVDNKKEPEDRWFF